MTQPTNRDSLAPAQALRTISWLYLAWGGLAWLLALPVAGFGGLLFATLENRPVAIAQARLLIWGSAFFIATCVLIVIAGFRLRRRRTRRLALAVALTQALLVPFGTAFALAATAVLTRASVADLFDPSPSDRSTAGRRDHKLRWERTLALVVIGILVGGVGFQVSKRFRPQPTLPTNAERRLLLDRAEEHIDEGAFEEALAIYRQAGDLHDEPCVHCLLGTARAEWRLEGKDAALSHIDEAMALTDEPYYRRWGHRIRGWVHLGLAFQEEDGRHWTLKQLRSGALPEVVDLLETSAAAYREALALDAGRTQDFRWDLATVLEWLGELDEAAQLFSDPETLERLDENSDPPSSSPEPVRFVASLEEVKPPKKISSPTAFYSSRARNAHVEGTVVLRTIIDVTGRIRSVRVVQPVPGVTADAITAVRKWQFEPAVHAGERIPIYFNVRVNFRLESAPAVD